MIIEIESLPKNLKTIGDYAFYNGGNNITIKEIPETVETIGTWAFSYCPNLSIEDFNVETIKAAAFYDSGINVSTINLGEKSNKIAYSKISDFEQAFERYGKSGQINFSINTSSPFYSVYLAEGLSPEHLGINALTVSEVVGG